VNTTPEKAQQKLSENFFLHFMSFVIGHLGMDSFVEETKKKKKIVFLLLSNGLSEVLSAAFNFIYSAKNL
jgi:hypothetical protein